MAGKRTRGHYGAGSLQSVKLASGAERWRWLYYEGQGAARKRRASPRFATRQEARSWAARFLAQGGADPEAARPPTGAAPEALSLFGGASRTWLDGRHVETQQITLDGYRQALHGHLLPVFGGRRLDSIRSADLNWYITEKIAGRLSVADGYKTKLSAPTLRRHLWIVRSVYRHAFQEEFYTGPNPAEANTLKVRATDQTAGEVREKSLRLHDTRKLFTALPSEWHPFVGAMLYCGLRFSEAAALRWRNFTPETGAHGTVNVNYAIKRDGRAGDPKTDHSHRRLAINEQMRALLDQQKTRQEAAGTYDFEGLIFPNLAGNPISNSNFSRRVLKKAAAEAGIKPVTPHMLRHTFARFQINAGCPPSRLSELMGHHSPAFTLARYGVWFKGDLEPVATIPIESVSG